MKTLLSVLIGLFLAVNWVCGEARVAILGDSITYGGRWATLVESALRHTPPYADAEIVNFGLGSETVSGLSEPGHAGGRFPRPHLHERLDRILDAFQPTLVLACYGMNDGIYLPLDESRTKAFRDGILKLKEAVESRGAKLILITPPLHHAKKGEEDPLFYDAVLDAYAAWLVSQRTQAWNVVDIRSDLREAVQAAKAADPAFVYAKDGVHPGSQGHDFIAAAICRQLWPILGLTGEPTFASGRALGILLTRNALLKHAWLSHTRHNRPGVPEGLPIEEAKTKAARLLEEYRAAESTVTSTWQGFDRMDFKVGGRAAILVLPRSPAPGNPWIWRTEFFGHQAQADIALVEKGFHLAYINVQNLYGAPVAMKAMDSLYDYLVETYDLSTKTTLIGMSRGGLFAFNWAALHPDRVVSIYVDAPVCDFKSWPGGKGVGPGSPRDWKRLLDVYQLTETTALTYDKNPVDHLAPLAKADIPILAVIGEADEVVPVSENIDVVEKRYLALGGRIQIIRKPGGKHHPHSLSDPKPIVNFVLGSLRQ